MYIEFLKEIYTNSSMTVHLHNESNKINTRRGDSKRRMDSIRQAPRHNHWNMLEKISLQVMRTPSNDIRCGNMDTHHPSKEQASSRTNKDGKTYVKHQIPVQKNKHLGKRKDKDHRRD